MPVPLRVLLLEDNHHDAALELTILKKAGYQCTSDCVETKNQFLQQLYTSTYDIILADYNLPTFDGLTALKLFLEQNLDIPFILVSGHMGEEIAIESLKAGATDYVLKNRLSRLEMVVQRALKEKEVHRQRKQAEQEIRTLYQTLEQRVADRTRELSTLYDITTVASQALDLETALEQSLKRVLHAMQSRMGAIHLLDGAKTTLNLAIQQNIPESALPQLTKLSTNTQWATEIISKNQSMVLYNLTPDSPLPQAFLVSTVHAYIGTPMRTSGQVTGILSVLGNNNQQFNVEEVALLSSIGDQVAMVIQNAQLHQQAEQAAVMKERSRLARELHDSVTQLLYSLTLLAGSGKRMAKAGTLHNVESYLTDLCEISQQALKEMRLLVHQLRPALLKQEGLPGALKHRLDAVERRSGIEVNLEVSGHPENLPHYTEEELYKIAQETLNNTLKYAGASAITVKLHTSATCTTLEIEDNGKGFDPEIAKYKGGMGLINIQERTHKLGGKVYIHSKPKHGTKLTIKIPQ